MNFCDTLSLTYPCATVLSALRRHDYLPFGEEAFAGTGGLTLQTGYATGDGVRQKFTQKERDTETGLDYFNARYYAGTLGRFTSPDPQIASSKLEIPQSWNRYSYCINNPVVLTDPSGLEWGYYDFFADGQRYRRFRWFRGKPYGQGWRTYNGPSVVTLVDGRTVKLGHIGDRGTVETINYVAPVRMEGQAQRNAAAGAVDGALPFGRHIRHAFGLSGGVDTNSPEYQNSNTIVSGVFTISSLLSGVGEARLASEGLRVASGAGGEILPMTVVRVIGRGERLEEIISEAKGLTWLTEREHALVTLANGERALVSGGRAG